MTLADRMVVMIAGVAEQIGTPRDVYERPATVFAVRFIGSPAMNVLSARAEGRVARLTNGIWIETGTEASGAVLLGIRPEHMERDPQGAIALDIRMAEPLGANTLLHGSLAGIRQDLSSACQVSTARTSWPDRRACAFRPRPVTSSTPPPGAGSGERPAPCSTGPPGRIGRARRPGMPAAGKRPADAQDCMERSGGTPRSLHHRGRMAAYAGKGDRTGGGRRGRLPPLRADLPDELSARQGRAP